MKLKKVDRRERRDLIEAEKEKNKLVILRNLLKKG